MDFMIKNNVQFSYEGQDQMYVATVKIVNKVKQVTMGANGQEQQSNNSATRLKEESKVEDSQGFDQYQAA